MEENLKITILYDIYGRLLTKRQQDIFEEYYLFNLSLREIADNKKISYQAVRDSIKVSEKMLNDFDDKLGIYSLRTNINEVIKIIKTSKDLNLEKEQIVKLLKNEDDI